jgi:hypothetical protein
MKSILWTLSFILLSMTVLAQENTQVNPRTQQSDEIKTLFGKSRRTGGYGGFSFGYADIDGIHGLTVGGKGGVIIGQHLTIGLAGKGFSNDYSWETVSSNTSSVASGGYGGLLIEPIFFPRFPIHLTVPIVLGAGGMASYTKYYDEVNEYWRTSNVEGSAFLMIEAGAEIEFNLTRHFRLALGANYRITTQQNSALAVPNLNGFGADLTFKFGKF